MRENSFRRIIQNFIMNMESIQNTLTPESRFALTEPCVFLRISMIRADFYETLLQENCRADRTAQNNAVYAQIVKQIDIDAINNISQPLWYKTKDDLHLLFRFLALGDRKTAQIFLEANMDKIKELGVVFIEVFPEHAIKLYKKGVRLRLFENHWNSTSLDALKALHDFSVEDYCAMLSSEVLLFANRISEMCILDFEKHDNTLYDIILYIKNTCPDALVHIVQILDFNKINKNKESMLKDTRFDKKSKKLFRNTIDLLLSCADGKCINELQAIKELK